jgi:ABC-type polysaccharide/polyol phosphate export permease
VVGLAGNAPPHSTPGEDERQQLARWARWDLLEGFALWSMWSRQSWNEVRRRYRRTLLGPAWVTVSLLIFALAMSFVWSSLFKQSVQEFLPFLLSGLVCWGLISGSIGESCTAFLAGEGLMKSRQFPYSTLIYVVLARNCVIFGHNLIGYFLVALLCGVSLGWQTLLLLPGTVLLMINCSWICVVVATFCLRFRDFPQLVASLLQISMFVTPVFWSASQLQGKRAFIVDANILHHMIEIVRQPLLGKTPAALSYLVCAVCGVLGWLLAYSLFVRKRHRLAYWF